VIVNPGTKAVSPAVVQVPADRTHGDWSEHRFVSWPTAAPLEADVTVGAGVDDAARPGVAEPDVDEPHAAIAIIVTMTRARAFI
jgi:hypothetical protein